MNVWLFNITFTIRVSKLKNFEMISILRIDYFFASNHNSNIKIFNVLCWWLFAQKFHSSSLTIVITRINNVYLTNFNTTSFAFVDENHARMLSFNFLFLISHSFQIFWSTDFETKLNWKFEKRKNDENELNVLLFENWYRFKFRDDVFRNAK